MVEMLIKAGADVNAVDGHSMTPLFAAVDKDNLAAVQVLLTAGADPDPKSETTDEKEDIVGKLLGGVSLYDIKLKRKLITPLTAAMCVVPSNSGDDDEDDSEDDDDDDEDEEEEDDDEEEEENGKRGSVEVVRALLGAGASPCRTLGPGRSLLALAAALGNVDVAALLLQAGADIDGAALEGGTGPLQSPMRVALLAGSGDVVRFLAEHYCDLSTESNLLLIPDIAELEYSGLGHQPELMTLLRSRVYTALPLLQSCLRFVRNHFKNCPLPGRIDVISSLPLPPSVVAKLLYKE